MRTFHPTFLYITGAHDVGLLHLGGDRKMWIVHDMTAPILATHGGTRLVFRSTTTSVPVPVCPYLRGQRILRGEYDHLRTPICLGGHQISVFSMAWTHRVS